MPFIPQCKWFMDIDTKDNEVVPRCTFIAVDTCMACGRCEGDPQRTYINTYSEYPSYMFITCKSKECVQKTMVGMADFYKNRGEYIMLFDPILSNCMVVRTSGDVEDGWSARGFYVEDEGVTRIYMLNAQKGISKVISYEDFIEINQSKEKALVVEINNYFIGIFNRLEDLKQE